MQHMQSPRVSSKPSSSSQFERRQVCWLYYGVLSWNSSRRDTAGISQRHSGLQNCQPQTISCFVYDCLSSTSRVHTLFLTAALRSVRAAGARLWFCSNRERPTNRSRRVCVVHTTLLSGLESIYDNNNILDIATPRFIMIAFIRILISTLRLP